MLGRYANRVDTLPSSPRLALPVKNSQSHCRYPGRIARRLSWLGVPPTRAPRPVDLTCSTEKVYATSDRKANRMMKTAAFRGASAEGAGQRVPDSAFFS